MWGQVVIGPPGSGKSTYCDGMQQFMRALGRDVAVVNLDPANDRLPYECAVDIAELITLQDVMDTFGLGPNGGLVYAMEYLEHNLEWLKEKLKPLEGKYLLFDFPGQIELFTHHTSVRNIINQLNKWDYHLAVVQLVDSHHCSDPAKFISVLLVCLASMVNLEQPHVNLLSKADMLRQYGPLALPLEAYTDVLDLKYLLEHLNEDQFTARFRKLSEQICSVVEDYALVAFQLVSVLDKQSMYDALRVIDKANGYIFADKDTPLDQTLFSVAAVSEEPGWDRNESIIERFSEPPTEEDIADEVRQLEQLARQEAQAAKQRGEEKGQAPAPAEARKHSHLMMERAKGNVQRPGAEGSGAAPKAAGSAATKTEGAGAKKSSPSSSSSSSSFSPSTGGGTSSSSSRSGTGQGKNQAIMLSWEEQLALMCGSDPESSR